MNNSWNPSWIRVAAVQATPKGTVDTRIATGYSHSDCYEYFRCAWGWYPQVQQDKYEVVEGYMLNNNTFISRDDALELVHCTGQLKPEYRNTDRLCSYMLNYEV